MTPSTALEAQDGVPSPPIQIYSVPRSSSDGLITADASLISTSALDSIYFHHFAQESTPQQLESSSICSLSIIANLREASDKISVRLDKMRKQIPARNIPMVGDTRKECFLCKTSFEPLQAKHCCRACGLFFDYRCTAVISTPNRQRKQDQKEDVVIMAREILRPLLINEPTVAVSPCASIQDAAAEVGGGKIDP